MSETLSFRHSDFFETFLLDFRLRLARDKEADKNGTLKQRKRD
jgi:hypothetical protein